MGHRTVLAVSTVLALAVAAPAHAQFDPAYEASNFSKLQERNTFITGTPGYQSELRVRGLQREADAAEILATDGPGQPNGRDFTGNLCSHPMDGCAGDVRFYDWGENKFGLVQPVLFGARNGSTMSGLVWMTAAGPAKRPGVVITNGSVQAPEQLYWFLATTLAKAGYVVMTWDPQGQGLSDTYGAGADRNDGVPSQSGGPFFTGTEDALDFFFSTPTAPYRPRKSCSTGTDHTAKHADRVARKLNSASNPFHAFLDTSRIGIAGHSLGAGAVSYIGQIDPRVSAIVGLDNLSAPTAAGPACTSTPASRPVPSLTKPALGIANDYGLVTTPNGSQPNADAKTAASKAISAKGVDSGQLVIRGGSHYEHSYIPNQAFGATLRGMDLVAWYTRAWMDKYVKGSATADAGLLTDRWRKDAPGAAVDPDGDPNVFSRYYKSRLEIGRAAGDGGRFKCEDLRTGCSGLAPDGRPLPFDALANAETPDTAGPGSTTGPPVQSPAGSTDAPPAGQATPATQIPACRDNVAPLSTFDRARSRVTRRGVTLSGSSADAGCAANDGRLVRVVVSVARAVGKGCRFLRADGSFGPQSSCLRTPYLPASGTTAWSLRIRSKLPKGAYKLFVRGVDAAGNIERKNRSRNFLALRIR